MADKKKVQTMVNEIATAARAVKQAADSLDAVRVKYQTHNPDVTNTPLQGKVPAANAWAIALRAVADDPFTDAMIAAHVPSHRGRALD